MFLLEKHCASSFDELQRGLENLRREVAKSEQAPAQFIRDNLDAFIQCYDTLSDIPFFCVCMFVVGGILCNLWIALIMVVGGRTHIMFASDYDLLHELVKVVIT